ncbi:AraC family transcriptional regulator [Novosphingobium sp. MMS21-SN21R]|uniref:AraC family transcriptional regulator n=1 Tax=Novosphingobium sp. MMS21-SN21R TaxID=2969298 RepID=UPI002883C732|nr:AraC family transcriptional regulator [Novosphingobium sp. MMS21-SN21R]MDT0510231.1 AraC family transcriptional regulator [Novosphingobium sp. MMS21-SN21R]
MSDNASVRIPVYSLFGQDAGLVEPRFCHVERIGDRWKIHAGSVQQHSHPHLHQLSFWLKGRGLYLADEARHQIAAGTLCWMPSGVVHGFRVEPGSEAVVLSMSDDFAREQFGTLTGGLFPALQNHLVVTTDQPGERTWLRSLFERMEYEYATHRIGQTNSIGALARVALIEGQRLVAEWTNGPVQDSDTSLLRRFMALVEQQLGQRPSVEALALELGTTPYLLNRACREAMGMRASDVVRARHMQEAKRLLLFSALRIAQIAQVLGYDDPAHFTRSFRNATGKVPREWRSLRTGQTDTSAAQGREQVA